MRFESAQGHYRAGAAAYSGSVARALRIDFAGPVEKPRTLTDGSIRVPALIARTGIQVYTYDDGTTVREYRPPEEVFKPASLETWPGLAITHGHPSEPVAPENWSALAAGHLADNVRKDGTYLAADVVIKDHSVIHDVLTGGLVEVSCGYFCDVEVTPGVTPEGEEYDAIQRNIIGNHVALGPQGWGRAGELVKLYAMDSKSGGRTAVAYSAGTTPQQEPEPVKQDAKTQKQDTTETQPVTISQADYDRVCAERDALQVKLAAADKPATEPTQTITTDSAVIAERVALRCRAARVDSSVGKLAQDPKVTDRAVVEAAIKHVSPSTKLDGKSDAYCQAILEAFTDEDSPVAVVRKEDSAANGREDVAAVITAQRKGDGSEPKGSDALSARERMIKRNQELATKSKAGK